MHIENETNQQILKLLSLIKEQSIILGSNGIIKIKTYEIPEIPAKTKKLIIERLKNEKAIEIVDTIYNTHPIFNDLEKYLEKSFLFDSIPFGYHIKALQPAFDNFYQEISKKTEEHLNMNNLPPLKVDQTNQNQEKWLIFQNDFFRIFYFNGKFYFNDQSKPFHSCQNNKLPRKIFDYACREKKLCLEPMDFPKIALTQDIRDAIDKTFRGKLMGKIKKICMNEKIESTYKTLDMECLRWKTGSLTLFPPLLPKKSKA